MVEALAVKFGPHAPHLKFCEDCWIAICKDFEDRDRDRDKEMTEMTDYGGWEEKNEYGLPELDTWKNRDAPDGI